MNRRDTTVGFECLICGREFNFLVDGQDLEKFKNSEITDVDSLENLFPYLERDEVDFITTKVCSNCL